jgi:hypothetical protein
MSFIIASGTTTGSTLVLRFDSTTSAHTGVFVDEVPQPKKRKIKKRMKKLKPKYGRVVVP